MDTVITPPTRNMRFWPLAILITAILFVIWLAITPNSTTAVKATDIWIGKITRGDMALSVAGYGSLKSRQPRLLAAQSTGTVEEILLKPGAQVTRDDVILRLSDPQVSLALRSAELDLQRIKNQYQQLKINQGRETLSQQVQFEQLKAELESAELEVTAQQPLFSQGIVSAIDYQRAVLLQKQLQRRLSLEQQRLAQLETLQQSELTIAKSNIDAQQEIYAVARQQFESLDVRAGIDGVVQSMNVELGQTVSLGQSLAMVGSTTDLYALINIPQSQLQQVKLGQTASIDTRAGAIEGEVMRINPIVVDGTIEVEVTLNGPLTANARPELNIQGSIDTGSRNNVLLINTPINGASFSSSQLYRVSDDGSTAEKVNVTFGAKTHDTIEVVSGGDAEQRFILSDMSRWNEHQTITIL